MSIEDIKALSSSQKLYLLKTHPVQAVMFFERRLDIFLAKVKRSKDKPIGEVDDYWIRIEFQSRGSPHVHSFWWIKDAPSAATVEGKRSMPAFIDKHISTQLPENDGNLRQLVEQLQCHKHTSTCYKKTKQKCRFDFPYMPCCETRLKTDADGGSPSRFYFTKRGPNDQWINAYNPQILKLWKGNMDIQMVGSHLGAAMYVCTHVRFQGRTGTIKRSAAQSYRKDST